LVGGRFGAKAPHRLKMKLTDQIRATPDAVVQERLASAGDPAALGADGEIGVQGSETRDKQLLTVDADGASVRVHHWPGEGADLPVVLLHGLFDTGAGWDLLCRQTGRDLYAFDLPGFGASTLPERPTLDSYAQRILVALRRLGIDRYVLVGHSLGAGIAARLAELARDDVQALVLMAPVGFGRIPIARAFAAPVIRDIAGHSLPMVMLSAPVVGAVYKYMVAGGMAPDRELVRRLRASAWQVGRGAKAATVAIAAAGERPFDRIGYDGPAFALWGGRDQLVPCKHADEVRRVLPQAEITVWPEMAHHPQAERPHQLLRYLTRAWTIAVDGVAAMALDAERGEWERPAPASAGKRRPRVVRDALSVVQRAAQQQAEVVGVPAPPRLARP
jgi:pimeloyl-ACP methyl ester carboxylesterase